jgi:hypothetical protein
MKKIVDSAGGHVATIIEGAELQKPGDAETAVAVVAEAEAAELPPPGTAKPSTWLD